MNVYIFYIKTRHWGGGCVLVAAHTLVSARGFLKDRTYSLDLKGGKRFPQLKATGTKERILVNEAYVE